ncbi:MAG TPA: hypothetical protein VJS38_02135 [Phenylobacterium sp.]|uniref:hypothetical protein n=1 Tax=Phenylobacterium sp. TaxID=1871053 RepID=UPI002B48D442|nr:hypothetical protein [Phenylobacterium sp.]HKR86947.1 hypothetical protein [Phenylobacterium sp.]
MNDIEVVRAALLVAASRGEQLSRSALLQAHRAELERQGRTESEAISEVWTDLLWKKLRDADLRVLAHKARHPDQFFGLASALLGQP